MQVQVLMFLKYYLKGGVKRPFWRLAKCSTTNFKISNTNSTITTTTYVAIYTTHWWTGSIEFRCARVFCWNMGVMPTYSTVAISSIQWHSLALLRCIFTAMTVSGGCYLCVLYILLVFGDFIYVCGTVWLCRTVMLWTHAELLQEYLHTHPGT